MKEDERDEKRAVNPARRRDEPRDPADRDADPPVKGTQGAELDPVDEGGIAE
ncbi:MAG TPA: hypothetical protein VHG51_02225 [Longimicrobiaceae bacterium]|nr:hypothetical protein [Longimicrobiaceae bacterium]